MDLDGTLLQNAAQPGRASGAAKSTWTLLAERLGQEALREENATKERWLRGEYHNYVHWMQDTIRIHQQYGLNKDIFLEVLGSIKEMPGARDAVLSFHEHGAVTAIISGGFKVLADRVQRSLKIHHAIAACEYFFHPQTGGLEHWNLLPSDCAGKARFTRLLRSEYRIGKRECAFVGHAQNDIAAIKEVGLSIGFNAQPAFRAACGHSVDQTPGNEDFTEVATIIEDACRSF